MNLSAMLVILTVCFNMGCLAEEAQGIVWFDKYILGSLAKLKHRTILFLFQRTGPQLQPIGSKHGVSIVFFSSLQQYILDGVAKIFSKGRLHELHFQLQFWSVCRSSDSTAVIQFTIWLFDYNNFLARVQRNCLNKQTEFSICFFQCYASKISYIPTPDSQSTIVKKSIYFMQ